MDKHDRSPLKKINLSDPWQLIATGFGTGMLPKMPGTFGSLAALPFCCAFVYLNLYLQLAIIVVVTVIGTIAADKTEKVLGMHDNSAIVIDEVAGMLVSCILYPPIWYLPFLAFILFRFFDILKPWPVGTADRLLKGGFGVMFDDLLAGCWAFTVFYLGSLIYHHFVL